MQPNMIDQIRQKGGAWLYCIEMGVPHTPGCVLLIYNGAKWAEEGEVLAEEN